jgi:hypothetical protein
MRLGILIRLCSKGFIAKEAARALLRITRYVGVGRRFHVRIFEANGQPLRAPPLLDDRGPRC